MHLGWKLTIAGVALVVLAAGWVIAWPPAYLPHEKIVLGLPWDPNDPPDSMIPMGETIYHPKPQVQHGHPGIDFLWNASGNHSLLAASDGTFWSAHLGASEPGKWDIDIKWGEYRVVYKELDDYNGSLSRFSHVTKGQVIGHAGNYCMTDPGQAKEHCWSNVHWELASMSPMRDRWCPVTYFEPSARAAVEALWASVPSTDKVKSQFPDICSGDYAGRVEP